MSTKNKQNFFLGLSIALMLLFLTLLAIEYINVSKKVNKLERSEGIVVNIYQGGGKTYASLDNGQLAVISKSVKKGELIKF